MTNERTDDEAAIAGGKSSRRSLLRLGAIAAPAVITLRSAWANGGYQGGVGGGVNTSLAMCRIPIDRECDKNGKTRGVNDQRGTQYFAPPAKGYYYGQELIDYRLKGTLPNGIFDRNHFDAHLKYIKNLKPGDAGFTCLTSLVHKL